MRRPRRIGTISLVVRAVIAGVIWFMAWAVFGYAALYLRPLPALAYLTATLGLCLLYPRFGPERWRRRRSATLGLRGLGPGAPWLALAVPAFLAATLFLIAFNLRLTSEPGPASVTYRFSNLPLGGLVIPVFGAVLGPVVEELAFRGFIQGRMVRRLGPVVGVAIASAVFAAMHLSRAWLPYYFAAGLLFGYARVATRSIWAPIALHWAANGMLIAVPAAFVGFGLLSRSAATPLLILGLLASWLTTAGAIRAAGRSVRRRLREPSPAAPGPAAATAVAGEPRISTMVASPAPARDSRIDN